MHAQQLKLCRLARAGQRDLNLGAGTADVVYRALKPYMRSFHISQEQFNTLAAREAPLFVGSVIDTIWPFDAFEIVIDDGGFRQELHGDARLFDAESYLMRVAIVQWSYPPDQYFEGIIDHEWMLFDLTRYPDGRLEHEYYSFMRGQPDGEYRFVPWPPFGQKHPFFRMWEQRMRGLPMQQWVEENKSYWVKLLVLCKNLADALQHSSVGAELVADPDRPENRQQRRAQGYIETDHYRIILRARAQLKSALEDVAAGKSLHPWARRRHKVVGHSRNLRKLGKIVPVREHMRGGKYGAGPEYDTTNFPLEGTSVHRRPKRRHPAGSPDPLGGQV